MRCCSRPCGAKPATLGRSGAAASAVGPGEWERPGALRLKSHSGPLPWVPQQGLCRHWTRPDPPSPEVHCGRLCVTMTLRWQPACDLNIRSRWQLGGGFREPPSRREGGPSCADCPPSPQTPVTSSNFCHQRLRPLRDHMSLNQQRRAHDCRQPRPYSLQGIQNI